MDKVRSFTSAAASNSLWAVIVIPVLAISWLGFYTIARAVGVPPLFAAGMSAAFDGVALFAARIGLKHRRKGFSGYLARITVLAFAALGVFVQHFRSESTAWVHAHSWIVWASASVAAVISYELHLGWVHRKQLIAKGYHHPSAKSGFGPATWMLIGGTWGAYRSVLRARRDFIATGNLARFRIEEAAQPVMAEPKPTPVPAKPKPKPAPVKPKPDTRPGPGPRLQSPRLHSVSGTGVKSARKPARKPTTKDQEIRAWCRAEGIELGYRGFIPIAALNAYRDAHQAGTSSQVRTRAG